MISSGTKIKACCSAICCNFNLIVAYHTLMIMNARYILFLCAHGVSLVLVACVECSTHPNSLEQNLLSKCHTRCPSHFWPGARFIGLYVRNQVMFVYVFTSIYMTKAPQPDCHRRKPASRARTFQAATKVKNQINDSTYIIIKMRACKFFSSHLTKHLPLCARKYFNFNWSILFNLVWKTLSWSAFCFWH